MSDWTYLTEAKLTDVRNATVSARLATHQILGALTEGIDPHFVAMLPAQGLPAGIQLRQVLGHMNGVRNLTDGTVPLAKWLSNAAEFAGNRPEVDVFLAALVIVRGGVEAPADETTTPVVDTAGTNLELEATIAGRNETLPVGFLQGGVLAARSVAKVLVPRYEGGHPIFADGDDPVLALGTGWLIAPGILITNHHVVNARRKDGEVKEPDATPQDLKAQAEHIEVVFDFYNDKTKTTSVKTTTDALLAYDKDLDFALLRLPDAVKDRKPLTLRKNPVRKKRDRPLKTRVNVLQHPDGQPMRLGFRDNFVVAADEASMTYLTDTNGGSSGSPVLDDSWRVAALHRGWRRLRNHDLSIRGRKVNGENHGVAVDALAAHLKGHARTLHDEIRAAQPG